MAGVHQCRGVERFFHLLGQYRLDLRRLGKCKLAAIGPATGKALADRGLYPDVCPAGRTGEALAQTLVETVRPAERVLLLRSAQGSPKLAQALRAAGLEVHDLALYTAKALPGPEPLPELDVLTFGQRRGREGFHRTIRPCGHPRHSHRPRHRPGTGTGRDACADGPGDLRPGAGPGRGEVGGREMTISRCACAAQRDKF